MSVAPEDRRDAESAADCPTLRGRIGMSTARQIREVFEYLHAHPEPGWQETNTTRYVANELRKYGCRVRTFPDHTGAVGDLGEGGPVVAIRADMDALRQEVDGECRTIHSCGHDAHMAMALGVLYELAAMERRPAGTVRFIFQPAEETGEGALRLVKAGVADDVDYLFGVHLRPAQELGSGKAAPAILHGAARYLEGRIPGEDMHAARPHLGINAIEAGASLVQAINGIRLNPATAYSAKLTSFLAGGQSPNIIPGRARFGIDLRAQSNEAMEALDAAVAQCVRATAALYRTSIVTDRKADLPAAVVHPEAQALLGDAIREAMGRENVAPPIVTTGGDDFHYYTLERPGVKATMLGLGCDLTPGLHHPRMTFRHEAMLRGTSILTRAILLTLAKGENGRAADQTSPDHS